MIKDRSSLRRALWIAAAACCAPAGTDAREALPGPVEAEVLAIIDGDTLSVRAHTWLDQTVETRVRIVGIDTPELRGDCDGERALAARAQAMLAEIVGGGTVRLRDISYDKFGGRVLASVETAAGVDARAPLLAAGLARPYDGRGARAGWCGLAAPAD